MRNDFIKYLNGYSNSVSRWLRFGTYYAMFPMDFAFDVINKYSKEGDFVLDPFSGRGTSIIASSALNRNSIGIEINPLGWIFTKVKLYPSSKNRVLNRLGEISNLAKLYKAEAKNYPEFFKICFCSEVLSFLIASRSTLDWHKSNIDRTLMGFILLYLHGKINESLSNQMRMTKSMGYNYSINWWKTNNYNIPPEINPSDFLESRIEWRYKKGKPNFNHNKVYLGDSSKILKSLSKEETKKISLLITSPPYCGITNYHIDQWLRLWLLGGPPEPVSISGDNKGRFCSKEKYVKLIDDVFNFSSKMMKDKSTVYVRTDAREFTFTSTIQVLEKYFPLHSKKIEYKPFLKKTQTQLYGDNSDKPGEIDIILTKKR